jgi:two-component system NtrC family sensor kinase
MWTGDAEDDVFEDMAEEGASLVVTLSHQKKTVGVLVLGRKLSDELFTQDDVDVVRTLAKTLSIAIINAKLFEQLSAAQAQAAQREKMAVIGTLSAGINHEICNPLGIIRGQCEVFLLNMRDGLYTDKDPKELVEKARVIMEKVVRETDRAAAITKKLASFAKPASGKMTPGVRIEEDLEEVISLVEHDLHLENIRIVKDFEEDLPMVTADKKQIQEIFFNIIRNASQAIKKNGQIDIKIFRSKNGVSVKVKDSGSGITKEDVSKIFNPFFTTKDPGEGSGLGLFIVKQIVERNNGRISVKSVPGEGSEFTVEFITSGEGQKVGI